MRLDLRKLIYLALFAISALLLRIYFTHETLLSHEEGEAQSIQQKNIDIVLGIAQDLDPKNFAVFCASIRNVSTAEVLVFMNEPIAARNIEIAIRHNIRIQNFEIQHLDPQLQPYHPSTLRWFLFHQFLSAPDNTNRFGRLWLVDVRDTYFQRDPFELLEADTESFLVFTGVEDLPIGKCGWNGGWVRDCFSTDVYAQVADKPIICSGVSAGTTGAVRTYLRLMNDVLTNAGLTDLSRSARFPSCERNGVDQGVHNVLVHLSLLPGLHIQQQTDGPVANLQAKRHTLYPNGIICNQQGATVHVVHQYDRLPQLQRLLFKRYVYWMDTDNFQEEWRQGALCSGFEYFLDHDLFKGVCDLRTVGGATSAASCCAQCVKTATCAAFTFFNGACYLKSCARVESKSSQENIAGAVSATLKTTKPRGGR